MLPSRPHLAPFVPVRKTDREKLEIIIELDAKKTRRFPTSFSVKLFSVWIAGMLFDDKLCHYQFHCINIYFFVLYLSRVNLFKLFEFQWSQFI